VSGSTLHLIRLQTGRWPRVFREPTFAVVASEEEFRDLTGAREEVPDLDRYVLILVARGVCPTGGYQVRVERVVRQPDGVRVLIRYRDPRPRDSVTMTMTSPVDAVLVPREQLPAEKPWVFIFRGQDGAERARRIVGVPRTGGEVRGQEEEARGR